MMINGDDGAEFHTCLIVANSCLFKYNFLTREIVEKNKIVLPLPSMKMSHLTSMFSRLAVYIPCLGTVCFLVFASSTLELARNVRNMRSCREIDRFRKNVLLRSCARSVHDFPIDFWREER